MLSVNEDIKDKIIFLRVDFNIPIKDGKVIDDTKIVKMKEIINKLLSKKTKIILCSHLGRPQKNGKEGLSLEQVKNKLENIFKKDIIFLNNYLNKETKDNIKKSNKQLFLLENIRYYKEEENNDPMFAKQLAGLADIYINEAFSCSHRAHASVTGITKFIKSYAGETIISELNSLEKIFNKSNKPVTCIIGGSKISTKIDLISNLIKKVDFMIIGGAMANNFIKYNNFEIGKSLFEPHKEETIKEIFSAANKNNCKLIIPEDVVVSANENIAGKNKSLSEIESNDIIFDIGTNTIKNISEIINLQLFSLAAEIICFIVSSLLGSNKDFPISKLLYFIKLLAIAPPIIIKSTFLIKLEIKSIFVDIFDPPILHVIGLLDL
jgi:phosphoglycerate kinase